jgi:hypothetical protein
MAFSTLHCETEEAMKCRHCSSEIPEGQRICPSCYASENGINREVSERRQTNVLVFISDSVRNNLFLNKITKYLQPDRVGLACAAETSEAFTEMTKNSSGSWGLLVVGADLVSQQSVLLNNFFANNPQVVVAVQYDTKETVPTTPPIAGAVLFVGPPDIDEWLNIMHQLVNLAEEKRIVGTKL